MKTKPRTKPHAGVAVALEYKDGQEAPRVSLVGHELLSRTVTRMARRYGVPIKRDSSLAVKLADVGAENEIPSELYDVVAELLCEVKGQ